MPDEKIMDKLGKIKAHMESAQELGNEAEAQAFAAKLQEMLLKHKLEMTDIQYTQHLKEEPVEEMRVGGDYEYRGKKRFMTNYPDVEVTHRRCEWAEDLMRVIARAHSCSFLVSKGTSALWIVGRKSDAAVAEYLFIVLLRAAEKMSHAEYMKFRRACRKEGEGNKELTAELLAQTHGFKDSWLKGFIQRLSQRFYDEQRKMEQDTTGTALMRINKEALAVKEYLEGRFGHEFEGEEELCKKCGKPEKDRIHHHKTADVLGGRSDWNTVGYHAGVSAADRVNLKANAMNEGKPSKELK